LGIAFFVYAVARSSVRYFNLELPGQCGNSIISLLPAGPNTVGCETVQGLNWLSVRVGTWNSAHSWAWLMIAITGLVASYYPRYSGKGPNAWVQFWDKIEGPRHDGVRGFCLAYMVVIFHELTWYFDYWIARLTGLSLTSSQTGDVTIWLVHYWPFLAFMLGGLVIILMLGYHHDLDKGAFVIGTLFWIAFNAGWVLAGFPITLDLISGATQFYNVAMVDFQEFTSWVLAPLVILFAYWVKAVKPETLA
jgi:hypothetical protein